MHTHRCGHDWVERPQGVKLLYLLMMGEPIEQKGCGHTWDHGEENVNNKLAHVCPKCGAGPWMIKHTQESCQLLGTRYEHTEAKV